jgi:bla regulator protein blaR1
MNSLQPGLLIMAQSLGWALLHSLWQALLVYTALRIVLKIISKPSARLSYNLSFLALCGVFTWFLHTWVVNWSALEKVVAVQGSPSAGPTVSIANDWASTGLYTNMVYLQQWLPLVALTYILGVLLLATRVVYNYSVVKGYKTKGVAAAPQDWIDRLADYTACMHIRSNVQLLFSTYITVPMVTGFIRPIILVPVATVNRLSVEQLEAILIHELAHIKRQDYLFNIVQVAMETVLFFNPFVWLLSSIIGREREHCCDDVVLEYTNQPVIYAHALTALETTRQSSLAIAATGNKKLLFNRIKRIVEMKKNTINSPVAGVLLIACLATSLAWFTPVIAQTVKQNEKQTSTTKEKIVIGDDNGKVRTYNSLKDVPAKDRKAMELPPMPPEPPVSGVDPVAPVAPTAPVSPVAPMAPVAPVKSLGMSGVMDSTIAIAMEAANKAISEANISIADANKVLAEIDWKEINEEIKNASKEVSAALKEIDWDKIQADVQKVQKDAHKEIAKAMKAKDKAELEARKADMEADKAEREAEKAEREAQKLESEAKKTKR